MSSTLHWYNVIHFDRIRFTRDVGGYPFLYADIFMDRQEFEEMFDLVAYEQVRSKYFANNAFPHLYDKVFFTIPIPSLILLSMGRM